MPNNIYWVLRHGRSKANAQCLIASSLANGVKPEYGLTEEGEAQADAAGVLLAAELSAAAPSGPRLVVLSSPFSRTRQTAERVAAAVGLDPGEVQVAPSLAERFFGAALELTSHAGYCPAWAADAADPTSTPAGDGESVVAVAARVGQLMQELESRYSNQPLLLVSHGDTLSVLAALAAGAPLGQHRTYGLDTAQLMRLHWAPNTQQQQEGQLQDQRQQVQELASCR